MVRAGGKPGNKEVVDMRMVVGDGLLKAFADIKIADTVIVKGFNVLKGKNGVFVAMPRKAGKDGRWYDVLLPVNDGVKEALETAVLAAYDREVVSC